VDPAGVQVQDAARVPDHQGADAVADRPAGDLAGGLVVGLPDPAQVPSLGRPLRPPVLAPAP